MYPNQIDEKRRTAIYVRISTAMQKTDRQVEDLIDFARSNRLNFDETTDIYKDIISGFKDGEDRPNFSILMTKLELGEYQQVLFSEFSRLERKPTNLLRDLEKFQSLGVYAWFSKQNLWVRDNNDLGTQIMIHILAVMSQYEIELFAARGLDGKISSMKNRGAYNGGPCPYGYTISPGTGKLVINPDEAEVVKKIFEKFSKGEKTAAVTDWLNASGIPCSFKTRIEVANQRRINKGIAPAKYKRGNVDNMIWRTTTVNRIVKNKVYIGVQHHKFHEPDPSNPLPARKRKNRVLLTEFDVQTPHTRIIDDELFYRVHKIFEQKAFNRNQSIRHANLLKTLLRCGECGSRFCTATLPMGRSYRCAGKTYGGRVRCTDGASILMSKLDGLVLKLCIEKFAKYDLQQKAKGKIQKIDASIEEKARIFNEYSEKQKEATETYTIALKRAIRYARDEAEADKLVEDAREDYNRVSAECTASLERIKAELDNLKRLRRSLSDIRNSRTLSKKSDEIMADGNLVKDYIHEIHFAAMILTAVLFVSCNKDGFDGNAKVTFRKANIAGSNMLALAQGTGPATKAEGDISIGPKALYTVSEDGTMVQVSYDIDVEGVNGEVAETIKAELIICPNFIIPVGEGWIWLANCHLEVKEGWSNGTIPQGPARSALSKIINGFSEEYHDRHGAHYLIRKSDGALFEWTLEAGAPDGMDDGFKQPTFLNGWFHQLGKDLFVRTGGWNYEGINGGLPSLICLKDKGNTLDAVNVLGDNIFCWKLYPAGGSCLGGTFGYPGANGGMLGIIAPPSFEPVLLQVEASKESFLLSIGGKLYYADTYEKEIEEGDGKGSWTRTVACTDFYNLSVSASSVSLGNLICTLNGRVEPDGVYFSTTDKLSWWGGNEYDGAEIHTLDPKAGTVSTRKLPAHYPSNQGEYVDGVAYTIDGTAGYWECDLSKDAAEYVTLDWSSASEYQGKIVRETLKLERFEAASLTLQFVAYMTNGTQLNFYTSVVGTDRGKIKTNVGSDGNAGMVVTTMVRLN